MTRQVNPNIGHVECHLCNEIAAVRRNKSGNLYYDCLNCGRIAPNHAGGQANLKTRTHIWPATGAPADVPKWIAENWPYSAAIRAHGEKMPSSEKGAAPQEQRQAPAGPPAASERGAAPARKPARDGSELPEAPPPPPEPKKQTVRKAPPKKITPPAAESPRAPSWLDEL